MPAALEKKWISAFTVPRDKQKDFTGILTEYDKDSVTIETEDETRLTFERADIALIRLAFDF